MLSFNDWPLKLEFGNSIIARSYFNALLVLCALSLLFASWLFIYSLLFIPVLLVHLYKIEQKFISLRHPESIVSLACQNGFWQLSELSGKTETKLRLERYFLSPQLITFLFICPEKRFYFFEKRRRILFFSDQISDAELANLIVCLKYKRPDLLVSSSRR